MNDENPTGSRLNPRVIKAADLAGQTFNAAVHAAAGGERVTVTAFEDPVAAALNREFLALLRGEESPPSPPASPTDEATRLPDGASFDGGARRSPPVPGPSPNEHIRAQYRAARRAAAEDYWSQDEDPR